MQKSVKTLILRVIALIIYAYLAGHGIFELVVHHHLETFLSGEGVLIRAEVIMFIGLLWHNNVMISIALVMLSTGNWLVAVRYMKLLFIGGMNLMTLLLVMYYLLYAIACAYILYVHILHPDNRLKTVGLIVLAHMILLGLRFLYVSVFNSVIYGVLPVNLLPQHYLATRAMSGVIIGLRATLFDGLLAALED